MGRLRDAFAVVTVLAVAGIIARPILAGGYATYIDNACHLAETYSLAFDSHNGWSDIAYCGYPLGSLHSPLWYGALARLVRAGAPAEVLYCFCLLLAHVAAPLALYAVVRRRLQPFWAASLAFLLLIQRPAIIGIGSALGGMWTFYLAAAAWLCLVDRLARRECSLSGAAWIASLAAILCLTHIFVYLPLVVVAAVHVIARVRGDRRVLAGQLAALVAGALAGAVFWGPQLAAAGHLVVAPQHLAFPLAAARLLLPTSVVELVMGVVPTITPRHLVEALPMIALVGAGIAGIVITRKHDDAVPLYGAAVGLIVFILVAVVAPLFNVKFLGPVSWRLLYFVRAGAALAAIPLVARMASTIRVSPAGIVPATIAALALAAVMGKSLSSMVPARDGGEMKAVRELWAWLHHHRGEDWGRVYLQDTFMTPPRDAVLATSHVLGLTARKTGVRQLGASYGVAPYPTAQWTQSEFGTLFRRITDTEERRAHLLERLERTNCTHLVVSDPRTAGQLLAVPHFERLHRVGRFTVMRRRNARPAWAVCDDGSVRVDSYDAGRISLDVARGYGGDDVLVRASYHPSWRFRSGTGVIQPEDDGLMRVRFPAGRAQAVQLEFEPPRWPGWITATALTSIAVLLLTACWRAYRGRRLTLTP